MIGLLFLLFFGTAQVSAGEALRLCGRVFSDRPIVPELDAIERRLVCGDDREGWNEIPFNQARFHLKTFLQNRGYHSAVITFDREAMHVKPGDPVTIKTVETPGAPPEVDITRRRKLVGEILTPDKLNETENWVRARLRQNGYACPTVESRADAEKGDVKVNVTPGPRVPISAIDEDAPELKHGLLRRYDAFHAGEYFDERELTLTERRIIFEGVVQAVVFDTSCTAGGVRILQKTVPGLPRTFSFGIGASTENPLIFRVGWKHSRITPMASLVDVTLTLSKTYQEFLSTMKWYVLPFASRFYLAPEFSVRHDDEPKFETTTVRGKLRPSTEFDSDNWFLKLGAGPVLEQTETIRGDAPGFTRLLLLETEATLLGHEFEYYNLEPQSGGRYGFRSSHVVSHNTSNINAHQLEVTGEWLHNWRGFEPPLLVLGGRFGASTTLANSLEEVTALLPIHFRYFLGGISNLRGFSRQELPYHGRGALTMAFAGFEARATGVLPRNLQPYVFVDGGAVGGRPLSLDPDVYWSPGVGIRWGSPIGVFRFNAAYGFIANRQPATPTSLSHAQFYIAYGVEF